ncbi:MAG: ABC transporter substrate-binding protein [Defluviitaleaceae bacterium]|nr:ABC transporter substrate-binding protein [Defluviitaleaceae bacterium]
MAKQTIRVGYLPIIDHLILGITKQKQDTQSIEKPFEHAQLDYQQKFGWNEVGGALLKGEIDLAFMLAPYAMDLYFAKKNLKLLLLSHRDGSVIVANKSANVTSFQDFKGKMVLIPYQSSMHHILLHKKFTEEGITVGIGKDVMTEVVAPGQIPMMIEYDTAGDIAGYIVAEPFGTQVVNKGMGTVLNLSKDIMPNHPCCAVVARDEIVEKYPEAIQEIITSFVQSGKLFTSTPKAGIAIATKFLNQPVEVMTAIVEDPNQRVSMDKLMPKPEEFEFMQNYLIDTVSTPALSGKIEVDKFVDLRFATAAGAE